MIHAYDEIYLDDAMDCLGTAVEYAVLDLKMDGQEFLNLFVASGIAHEFGKGNVRFVSGMSGIELCQMVLKKCGIKIKENFEETRIDYTREYWIGWILAHYQWYSGKPFFLIVRRLPFMILEQLYGTLHEADISKSTRVLDQWVLKDEETNLAVYRKNRGFSQSQLAKEADISIRSIQLYEQRQTDINKAQYNHLRAIALALKCRIEDILE